MSEQNVKTIHGLVRRHVGSTTFDPKNLPESLRGEAKVVEKPKKAEKNK